MTGSDWAELIGAWAWPLTLLVVVLVLRRPLGSLFESIGGRITGLTVASVSIQLATPVDPPWTGFAGADVRRLVPASNVNDSYFSSLRQALASEPSSMDYFVVDLKSSGSQEWLSSRLYVFAWVLSRVKGVRAVVFVETRDGIMRSFVGLAFVDDVMVALERAEPWLRLARWETETTVIATGLPADRDDLKRWQLPEGADLRPVPDASMCGCCGQKLPARQVGQSPPAPPSPPSYVDAWWKEARSLHPGPLGVVQKFTEALQWHQPESVPDPGPGWLMLPSQSNDATTGRIWEHTRWIGPADLVDGSLRHAIRQDAAVVEDQSQSKSKRARALVRVDSDLVASLSSTGRQFKELIDRRALLQSLGAAAADE